MLDYMNMEDGRICIKLDEKIYSLKSIYRTAYSFIDQYYIGIDHIDSCYMVYLSSKDSETSNKSISGEFQNELLHQCLRSAVEEETKQIRELILTRALYSSFIPEDCDSQEEDSMDKNGNMPNLDDIARAWYYEKKETE